MKGIFPCLAVCASAMLITSITPGTLKAAEVDPTGSITTDRNTVLANSIVNVKWNARYPAPIVKRDKTTLTPVTTVRADVRVVGAAFGPTSKPYPVRGWVKTSANNTTWTQIFLGNNKTVNPQTVVWSKVLAAGEKLDFKFQGSYDNTYDLSNPSTIDKWQTAIDTTSSSLMPWNRAVLVDGETSPNYNPAFDQGDVHSHLAAYFHPGTTKVKLGPRDYIYLTELSPYNQGHSSTDMQDLVLLVTFTEITEDDD
ncbi:MAG: hypothetical protein ACRCXD_12270 [Luteolibacter sp.]